MHTFKQSHYFGWKDAFSTIFLTAVSFEAFVKGDPSNLEYEI